MPYMAFIALISCKVKKINKKSMMKRCSGFISR